MALRTLGARAAAALDAELMSTGAFSLDQLMELAGLSVSQAVYKLHPPSAGPHILVACGPGNNGGDGLVAARHLAHYGYKPTVYYPKRGKNPLYEARHPLSAPRLTTQLVDLRVPFTDDLDGALEQADHVVDAIFGFSFAGTTVREPFGTAIRALSTTHAPVLSVDAPSAWDVELGPPTEGPGAGFRPAALISLTAPKPLVRWFRGRHFVGGRFLTKDLADKYGIDVPPYQGMDQIVEVAGQEEQKL